MQSKLAMPEHVPMVLSTISRNYMHLMGPQTNMTPEYYATVRKITGYHKIHTCLRWNLAFEFGKFGYSSSETLLLNLGSLVIDSDMKCMKSLLFL